MALIMALIILIENLVNALDNGKCAVGIFLDFQKAFDAVDYSIYLINCTVMVKESQVLYEVIQKCFLFVARQGLTQ